MITPTDKATAAKLLPSLANKTDETSIRKVEATAQVIAKAMLPEREALSDLVSRLEQVQAEPTFKAVFEAAKAQGVFFRGKPWKEEFDRAKAIVDTYPGPTIEGEQTNE